MVIQIEMLGKAACDSGFYPCTWGGSRSETGSQLYGPTAPKKLEKGVKGFV